MTLAGALRGRAHGWDVELHDDHFDHKTTDIEWIRTVAARGWVILTKDYDISINASERDALLNGGARAFLFTRQGLTGAEMARAVGIASPRIKALAALHEPPLISRITPSGDVIVLWELRKEWRRRRQVRHRG